jgi:hypothetical protein
MIRIQEMADGTRGRKRKMPFKKDKYVAILNSRPK